jgi:hypothetical protein
MSTGTQVDYDALAKQYGAVSSQPATVDYDALAKQYGAVESKPQNRPDFAANPPGIPKPFVPGLTSGGPHVAAYNPETGMTMMAKGAHAGQTQTPSEKQLAEQVTSEVMSPVRLANAVTNTGVGNIAHGVKEVGKGNFLEGGAEALGGLGETLAPLMGPAGAEEYLVTGGLKHTAKGLATAMVAAPVARETVKALGGSPQAQDFAEQAGQWLPAAYGAVRGSEALPGETSDTGKSIIQAPANLIGRVIRRTGGGSAADVMDRTSTIAPAAGKLSNAEVNQFAASKGIDLLPGQATESRPVQAIQAVGERAITPSGETLARHKQTQHLALQQSFAEAKNATSPEAGMDANGRTFAQTTKSTAQSLKSQSTAKYQAFRDAAGDVPVDLTEASDNLIKRLDQYGLEKNEIPAALSKVYEPAPESAGPREIDIARAQTLRSNALDIARTSPDGRIRSFARGVAEDLTGAIEKAADSVISEAPEGQQANLSAMWKDANSTYKKYAQAFADRKSPLYNLIDQRDPAKSVQRFAGPGTIGGSVENVKAAQAQGIDLSPVKRVVLENIEKKNFRINQGGNAIAGYSPQFLQTLFSPEELRNIQLHAQVARKIGFEMNPSGTSNVQSAEGQIKGILGRSMDALAAPVAARLTLSEGFKRGVMGDAADGGVPNNPNSPPPSLPPAVINPSPKPSPTESLAAKSGLTRDAATGRMVKTNQPAADQYGQAKQLVQDFGKASTSLLQRRLRIGYGAAVKLIDRMHSEGLVGPADGAKPREWLEAITGTDESLQFRPKEGITNEQVKSDDKVNNDGQARQLVEFLNQSHPELAERMAEHSPQAQKILAELSKEASNRVAEHEQTGTNSSVQEPQPAGASEGAGNHQDVSGQGSNPREARPQPSSAAGQVEAVSEPSRTGKAAPSGAETSVRVPGEQREYPARYQVRELDDVKASHSGVTFKANPKYALVNDRDYSNAANQGKVINNSGAQFDPSYHITDNPDATNGPVVIDSEGHALGGNGRAMILDRVYKYNAEGVKAYKEMLAKKAAQFGLDPEQIKGMKKPVLVREINDSEFEQSNQKQTAITDFNKKGTAELTPSERAITDSRRVSQNTLGDLASRFDEAGKDATLADILRGANAHEIVDRLINDGVISPQERAAYVGKAGLSDAAKDRISNLVVGRFFRDPAQLDTVPVSVRNKLERLAAPLSKADVSPEWSLEKPIQEAMDILEEVKQRDAQTVDDVLKQQGLFGGGSKYSPKAIMLAKGLKATSASVMAEAARKYAIDAADSERSLLGGSKVTPEQAFEDAFTEATNPMKKSGLVRDSETGKMIRKKKSD